MPEHDVARFHSYVVAGPDDDSCSLWRGAIGTDSYGPNRPKRFTRQRFPNIGPSVNGRSSFAPVPPVLSAGEPCDRDTSKGPHR